VRVAHQEETRQGLQVASAYQASRREGRHL
jgi:hypothetical protein